jgi:hypothetical protein
MTVVAPVSGTVHVPHWVVDEESCRRWSDSAEFPKHVPIRFDNGDVFVDLRPPGKQGRRYETDRR